MYLAARGIEGITGWTEKQWNRIDIAGKGGGGMDDLFSLLGATLLKFLFRPTAKKFMEERARRTLISLDPTGPKGPELVTPKEYMDKIAATVLDPEVFSAYIEILKENGISMDENTLKSLLKEAGQQAERESEQEELDWNKEFYDDIKDLETKVFADSDAVKLLKLYNAAESQNAPALSGDKDSTGPDNDNQSKEQQRVEMSYRVFAGKILVEAGLQTLK
ncbi:uncharacterized protein ACHE_41357A [Aspergillus chevalieri]|uniref:Uncharacterized protein n=1 Tax=Aspergillus chevalieri TaxID=182096 RepID=A0A7R7VRF0_ASPCH|nr:uncharacterized protein ACHE_41357A [Aspergillus chevalieri]BCR88793.1 hypothetical protein ACHE_41357A [Aspergillus chevalieri]